MEAVMKHSPIEAVREVLKPVIIHTPLMPSNTLNSFVNGEVYLKLENLQRTGAFKFRGAYNKLQQLSSEEKQQGVIACSAGNHAQGVALAASLLGIRTRIFMPLTAPVTKVEATKSYGAEVILVGGNFDETKQLTLQEAEQSGELFVSPFDDLEIIHGQGTIGLEIMEDLKRVDNIIVPIGGGGLIAGIALAVKEKNPAVKIIGVQSYQVHGMIRSIWAHERVANRTSKTLADGCDVALAGALTYEILKQRIDETVLVEEKEIEEAVLFLALKEKVIAEGAGALSTAAILSGKINHLLKNRKTVAVVSGGNIDFDVLKSVL